MKYLLPLIFIIYVIVLSFFSKGDFPESGFNNSYFPYLSERPLTEDGFYSLKIAWNIGTGKGITYNFEQPTTGFQPLYVFILSIFAFIVSGLGGDKIVFLRLVILLSGFTALLLSYVFYRLINGFKKTEHQKTLMIFIFLLVLFNFKLFLNLFNGLETGIYLIFLVLSMILSQKIIEQKKSSGLLILFGFILGLTVLARIDSILIVLFILLTLLFTRALSKKEFVLISLIAFSTLLPWLYFVLVTQGSIIPSSVSVQTGLTSTEFSYRIDQFFFSIFSNYIPWLHSGQTQSLIIYILTLIFIVYLYKYQKAFIKNFFKIPIIKYWSVAILISSIVYLIFAYQPYFFFRYLSIHILIAIPFLALLITNLLAYRLSKFKSSFIAIVLVIFFLNAGYYFHYPKQVTGLALRTSFIEKNKLFEQKIGMAQSGISGYFFNNILNLDGKVNNEALKAIKGNYLFNYITRENISVLIEWEEWFDNLPSAELKLNWQLFNDQIKDNKTIVMIKK
ncbi:MAG: hypothetical protein RBR74_09860 [Ignavibacteriaceae bacterium]|jgi:hypothetical protein|nr:hypothetical protein [Ignavibacteriaceae bacterium]